MERFPGILALQITHIYLYYFGRKQTTSRPYKPALDGGYMSRIIITSVLLILINFAFSVGGVENPDDAANPSQITTGDLYKVILRSDTDAEALRGLGVKAVLRLNEGYLVLADLDSKAQLENSGLEIKLITTNISKNQLALDIAQDDRNIGRYELIYQEDQVRVLKVEKEQLEMYNEDSQISPILTDDLRIFFPEPKPLDLSRGLEMEDLQTMISFVRQDSITSYVERLQAFYRRPALSDSNLASRDWLASKFTEFGYDSVYIDTFSTSIITLEDTCFNVVAYKIGTLLPDHHIIVGAHRDAVDVSPGADDNGSGAAAVLEIARILKDYDTYSTIVFILFDAEELGLLGSWAYADEAAARGDSIIYMLNLDMIGAIGNSGQANIHYGSEMTYTDLWASLADSLVGLGAVYAGASTRSDHYPFIQNGYEASFIIEYNFSPVYHTEHDSTTYMSFKYLTRIAKASLATAYVVSQTYTPFSVSFDFPNGLPTYLSSMEPTTLDVIAEGIMGGTPVPGTARLHYSLDGVIFDSILMTELSPNHYEVDFPLGRCMSNIKYYFSAEEEIKGICYQPDPGDPYHTIVAAEYDVVLDDDFELDYGWTVNGNAVDGHWERGVPVDASAGDPPTDYDGSGSCYLTANRFGNSDVDYGATNLLSPQFDLFFGDAKIRYARWYSNFLGYNRDDVMRVFISNDDGDSWTLVEQIGPIEQSDGGWYENSFWVSDFVDPSALMRLRFEASDLGGASTVEAAIDAVTIEAYYCPPFVCGDANADEIVNVSDAVYIINYVFAGGDPPNPTDAGDTNCDAATNVSDAVWIINHIFTGGNPPCDMDGDGEPDC
jgi:hypothetical protein